MKVYTEINLVWDGEQYVEESSKSYEYNGVVAEAKGGGQETTSTDPWVGQQPYLEDLFGQAQEYYQRGAPGTEVSRDLTAGAVGKYGEAASGVEGYLDPIRTASQGYATGGLLDPANNPAFAKYLDLSSEAITKQFTEGFLPQLTGGAVAAGNIGSSRQGVAEGIGAGKTLDVIGRNVAGLTSQAYGQGLQATMQAQALAPALAGTYGVAPRLATEGARLQYGLETQQDAEALDRLEAYQQLIGGSYGSVTTGPGTKTGGLSGALGGAATGAYLGPVGAAVGGVAGYFS